MATASDRPSGFPADNIAQAPIPPDTPLSADGNGAELLSGAETPVLEMSTRRRNEGNSDADIFQYVRGRRYAYAPLQADLEEGEGLDRDGGGPFRLRVPHAT